MDLGVVILVGVEVVVEVWEWVVETGGDATARVSWFYRDASRRRASQISLWWTLGCHSANLESFRRHDATDSGDEMSGGDSAKGRHTR